MLVVEYLQGYSKRFAYRLHDLIYDLASKLTDERKPKFWYTSGSIRQPDNRMIAHPGAPAPLKS